MSFLLQTMAIATLAACYNNPRVFTGVVKIRKGQAVELMMASTNMDNLKCILAQHAHSVRAFRREWGVQQLEWLDTASFVGVGMLGAVWNTLPINPVLHP